MIPAVENRKKPSCYLLLLLLFILSDILCDSYVLRTFEKQSPSREFFLFTGLLLLQFFAAPIQAGISDFYSRKKSLTIALSASFLAILSTFTYDLKIFIYFPLLLFAMLVKGLLGNTIPLAWASIADTKDRNFRFSFGLSTAAFAVGYCLWALANQYLTKFQIDTSVVYLYFILPFLSIFFFKDIRNNLLHKREHHHKKKSPILLDIKLIHMQLQKIYIRNGLYAFFLWEVSLYSILLLYIDFGIEEFSATAISMMVGYLLGVLTLKFCRKVHDETMINIGYVFSVISLIPIALIFPFIKEINYTLLSACYFFHTFGNAFLCSTFFAIISKESKLHEQGKNYGIIGAADTASFLIASIIVMIYNAFKLNLEYIILVSFFTAAISWIPYQKFKHLRPKTQ